MIYFILDQQHRPIRTTDVLYWAEWFENTEDNRRVALTETENWQVSTVFLGLDHQFGRGPPLLFETMAFRKGGGDCEQCERYSTWDDAEAGHAAMVRRLQRQEVEAPTGSPSITSMTNRQAAKEEE
ncbi:hypothetical protein [Sinorhizobium meliloti]